MLVHFPVGLLLSGSLFELYGKLGRDKTVALAGWFNVRLGFWCALPVAVVGVLGLMSIEVKQEFRPFVSYHILGAFLTLFVFLCVLLISRFRKGLVLNVLYYLFLLAGLVSVLGTGYFGSELVHRFQLPQGPP